MVLIVADVQLSQPNCALIMPGGRTSAKLKQRGEYMNASTSASRIPDARETVQVEMIEMPHYHRPWDNCKPPPASGMIPNGYGHDKFTYAFDRKNPVLPYISPLPRVTAFTTTSSILFLAEDGNSKKASSNVKPIQKETKGPLGDVVKFLAPFANHLCACCMSYYCTKKPHHSPAWTFEVYPPSAPKPAEEPCGFECYLLPGPCRTYVLDGDEVEAAKLKTILKMFLTEGPLCQLRKCERPLCDGNCDRATCCQLAEMIERPCRVAAWVIQELINATPKDCQPVRPRIPAGLVPSIRIPHDKNHRTAGERFQYKACFHPSYSCNQPKANCRCHKYNTGCHASCCCSADCVLRNMCRCMDGCSGDIEKCHCLSLKHMCVRCNVAKDFGQTKKTLCGRSTVQGMGTFIMEDVPATQFIDEYTGELMTNKQNEIVGQRPDFAMYAFDNNAEFTVDAWRYGNNMRFINHSEHNENVLFKVTRVNGEHKIGVFATRDLKAGEELFIKYAEKFDPKKKNGKGKTKKEPSEMQIRIAEFIDVPLSPEDRVPQESELVHASPLPKERVVYGRDVMQVTAVFCSDDVLSPEEKKELMRQLNDGLELGGEEM